MNFSIFMRLMPCTSSRMLPSGARNRRWIIPIVPISNSISGLGSSTAASLDATSPIIRSLFTTSSTNRIERAWPIVSGTAVCGYTTKPRSGRIGNSSGTSLFRLRGFLIAFSSFNSSSFFNVSMSAFKTISAKCFSPSASHCNNSKRSASHFIAGIV